MKKQVLVNAKIVNEGTSFFSDVLIHHGRIEKIAPYCGCFRHQWELFDPRND
jgi:dihydroorotase-like cyclic amidohydrolase